jgi:hypothetical protein
VPLAQAWTHSLFFTFSELKFSKFGNVNTFRAQLIVPNPTFAICLNFQQQNSLKNEYLQHLSSKNCEINSIKSDSPRAFQQHQERPQIPIQFSDSILFNFRWENGSIINSFHIVAPNTLKPSWCTPTHHELSKDTKSTTWSTVVWEISTWKTKQTTHKIDYLAS